MRFPLRFSSMFAAIMVVGLAVSGYAQKPATDAAAAAAIANSQAGFGSPVKPIDVNKTQPNQFTVSSDTVFDAVTGAIVSGAGASGQSNINTAAGRAQTGNDDDLVNGEV